MKLQAERNESHLIRLYQQKCFSNYKDSLGLDQNYSYYYGNPVLPQVPIEVTCNKVMIIGAYPSAQSYKVNNKCDAPIFYNGDPTSNEKDLTGTHTASKASSRELDFVILKNIGIRREDCWITDLVKVFLFKKRHVDKHHKLEHEIPETRSSFIKFANLSLPWLHEELAICQPRVIITLGADVASVVSGRPVNEIVSNRLTGQPFNTVINNSEFQVLHLPHPGILMRKSPDSAALNPWPKRFKETIAPNAHTFLKSIGLTD